MAKDLSSHSQASLRRQVALQSSRLYKFFFRRNLDLLLLHGMWGLLASC